MKKALPIIETILLVIGGTVISYGFHPPEKFAPIEEIISLGKTVKYVELKIGYPVFAIVAIIGIILMVLGYLLDPPPKQEVKNEQ